MTMLELAKLANVSVSTVSKAFNEANDVSEETKKLIFEIAKANGCYGKFYKGKFHKTVIAMIIPEVSSNHYTTFVDGLRLLIEKSGGICMLSVDSFNEAKQAELIEYYASYMKVDGIIVFGLKKPIKKGYETPIISLFSSVDSNVDTVNIDISGAIEDAVRILHEYGHRKIAFISEKLTKARKEMYKRAMLDMRNNDIITVDSSERFEKAGTDGVKMLLDMKKEFTAIICAYDYIALGAIKELKKNGYRIPEDVSVIGIDNISQSEYADVSLSSIDNRPSEVCQIVFDLLEKKLKNPFFRAKQNITIASQVIIRDSVTHCKKGL